METATTRDLLIEIGTEELPPKALKNLAEAFENGVADSLIKAQISFSKSKYYASPRRLAILLNDVVTIQPSRQQERRGPALAAAFDAENNPTKAALGFARSCGVEIDQLSRLETEKGVWLAFISTEPGRATSDLIVGIVEKSLANLPIPRRMRWGDRDDEFVRPIHWVLLLFGSEVIPATIFGISADKYTYGHRFHHPGPIEITEPEEYVACLQTQGKVIADFAERRNSIRQQTEKLANRIPGTAQIDNALLDEVTALVEWPVAVQGNFDPRFLQVPSEALVTTMQDNQKYFPVTDLTGKLLPHFITIANIESKAIDQVRSGNERVIRPRFSDAEFFWQQDNKQTLESHRNTLKNMIFQKKLGSLYEKTERVAKLAAYLTKQQQGNTAWALRAAMLCKCDLLTNMVQEFPALQGTMGKYYAFNDGEADEVALAQEEQYLPRFSGDSLPGSATGRALAIADRLDTLVGIFAIAQAPSGNRDPFGLRRAALGVLRILIEGKLNIDLKDLLKRAADGFAPDIVAKASVSAVFDFMMDRLRAYYLEQGVSIDTFEAVLDRNPRKPLDFDDRVRAVTDFRALPQAESLAAANKRIRNILRQSGNTEIHPLRHELLIDQTEQRLAEALSQRTDEVIPLFDAGAYADALACLAGLRDPVDAFFDDVMVMVDDPDLKNNRLALLNQMSELFLRVADLSRLQN